MYSQGVSIVDVRDPRAPRTVEFIAAPKNTWNIHLQAHDDLLMVVNARDMKALPAFADDKSYYKGKASGFNVAQGQQRTWTAGMAVWDIAKPKSHGRSVSCRSRAAGSIASGMSAVPGPMPRR